MNLPEPKDKYGVRVTDAPRGYTVDSVNGERGFKGWDYNQETRYKCYRPTILNSLEAFQFLNKLSCKYFLYNQKCKLLKNAKLILCSVFYQYQMVFMDNPNPFIVQAHAIQIKQKIFL